MENVLKSWREKSGLRLAEAAEKFGVTAPMLSRWETGTRRIPAERVSAISKATGIPSQLLRPDVFEGMEPAE